MHIFKSLKTLYRSLLYGIPSTLRNIEGELKENQLAVQAIQTTLQEQHRETGFLLQGVREEEVQTRLLGMKQNEQFSWGDFVNPELGLLAVNQFRCPIRKKQILLVGFYGGYNLGDELMLQTVLEIFSKIADVHITIMLAENAAYDASIHGDIDILHYVRTYSDYSHLSSFFDGMVVGGGALLDECTYGSVFNHFLSLGTTVVELPKYFAAKGKPTCFLGLSTNQKLSDAKYLCALDQCVRESMYFSLRDTCSLGAMREAGISAEGIDIVDDLLLANSGWLEQTAGGSHGEVKNLAVTWVADETRKQLLIHILEQLAAVSAQKRIPLLISLVPAYAYLDIDQHFFSEVYKELSEGAADITRIVQYPTTLSQARAIFAFADAALNVRYHTSLICACEGVPQTQVILTDHRHYPNKMKWIADNFSAGICVNGIDDSPEEIVSNIFENLKTPRKPTINRERVAANRDKLLKHLTEMLG